MSISNYLSLYLSIYLYIYLAIKLSSRSVCLSFYLCSCLALIITICICPHIHIYTDIHRYNIHTCMHACIHTYMHTYISVYVYTYTGVYIYVYTYVRPPLVFPELTCPETQGLRVSLIVSPTQNTSSLYKVPEFSINLWFLSPLLGCWVD